MASQAQSRRANAKKATTNISQKAVVLHSGYNLHTKLQPSKSKTARSLWNALEANVILKATDSVEFRVRKGILMLLSETFTEMFSEPPPPPAEGDPESFPHHSGFPLYKVPVNSAVLEQVLLCCYAHIRPLEYQTSVTLPENIVFALAKAGYDFKISGVVFLAKLNLQRLAKANPWRIYCLASYFDWREGVLISAQATLPARLDPRSTSTAGNLAPMPDDIVVKPSQLQALETYRRDCTDAVSSLITYHESRYDYSIVLEWFSNDEATWFTCTHSPSRAFEPVRIRSGRILLARRWFTASLRKLLGQLLAYPSPETVLRAKSAFLVEGIQECATCKLKVRDDVESFLDMFAVLVQTAINKVEFDFGTEKRSVNAGESVADNAPEVITSMAFEIVTNTTSEIATSKPAPVVKHIKAEPSSPTLFSAGFTSNDTSPQQRSDFGKPLLLQPRATM